MDSLQTTSTIAAISTPVGEGGIGIVRVSGPDALAAAERVFRARSSKSIASQRSHTVRFGCIVDGDDEVDQALCTVFRAPHSYTGDDTVELSTHGGPAPLRRTLSLLLRAGARLAGPGEFTQRAFLNGRLDLSQAEAVIDSIRARSDAGLKVAVRQLEGALSARVEAARAMLLAVVAEVEASTDFPDEAPEPEPGDLIPRVAAVLAELERLLATAESGRVYREGLSCVIVGRPNVGKSSILNALLRDNRAIVTAVPGTTRDVLEETAILGGVPVRLVDTAGLRETEDVVERIGVERAQAAMSGADILLCVLDAAQALTREDELILEGAKGRPALVVLNKSDLRPFLFAMDVEVRLPGAKVLKGSAVKDGGMADVENALTAMVTAGLVSPADVTVSHVRHRRSLEVASESLRAVLKTLTEGWPLDLAAQDLQTAIHQLGEISGQTVSDRVIQEIFSRFCVGK
ncbi:MAG TPA: tRNA uridine-5-carboxymethylaminomethyl(34) synthesis GTPase MnmE [Armatimonadota bacterium]|jgi:tRNA modification GTPase